MYEKQTKISRNELQKRFKYVFITYDIYLETLRSTSLISTPLSLTLVYLSRIKSFKDCNINFHSFFYSFFFIPVPQVGLKNLTYRSSIDNNNNINNTDYLQAINATQQRQGTHIQQQKSNSLVNSGVGGSIMDDFFKQLNGTTSHMSNFTQPAALVEHKNATITNAANTNNSITTNIANSTNANSTNTGGKSNTTVSALSPELKKNITTANTMDHSTASAAPHIKITRNGGLPLTPAQQNQHHRNLSSLSSSASTNKLLMNNNTAMNNLKNNNTRTSLFKGNTTKTINGKETFYYKPNNNNSTNTNRTSTNGTLDFNNNNTTLGFNNNSHTNKLNLTNRNVRKSEIPHPSSHHLAKVGCFDLFSYLLINDIVRFYNCILGQRVLYFL